MAKKSSGRSKASRKGFRVIRFKKQLGLSTLADGTVLIGAIGSTLTQKLHVISMDAQFALRGGTAGEGPIFVGYCHPDLSVAEVAECLDAAYTGDEDIITNEQRRRPVRDVGVFNGLSTEEVLNDGKTIRTKIRFNVEEGKSLPSVWARNESGAALTGGQILEIYGKAYCRITA